MEFILTAIAKDRPGIVEEISAVIEDHSGNWIGSSMSRLGGEFAGIVQIAAPEQNADKLIKGLAALRENGISIECKIDQTIEILTGTKAEIEITGLDHQGIVHEITDLLADLNISIDHLETNIFTASMAGEPMFHARAEIRMPDNISQSHLTNALEAIANDIMVDLNLVVQQS